MKLAEHSEVKELIALAKKEDLGSGDLTSALLENPEERAAFQLVARQCCVLAGCEIAPSVLQAYDERLSLKWEESLRDSAMIPAGTRRLGIVTGPRGKILSSERVLLNFLQRMCAVATRTREFVDAVAGTHATIFDTRKTIPGWRQLDKYAVRCGGGCNHRAGLYDAVLIKDNHLADIDPSRLAFQVFEMLNRLESGGAKPTFVEVEAGSLAQVEALLKVVGVQVILLDNLTVEQLHEAVVLRKSCGLREKIIFEASGGITLENVSDIARAGVERISVGGLTHSPPAIDLALEPL